MMGMLFEEQTNLPQRFMAIKREHRVRLACAALAAVVVLGQGSVRSMSQEPHKNPRSDASFQTLSDQATAALDADRVDEAIPLLRKALGMNPRWAEGWWSLATAYYDQDRYAEAALAFQKVVALNPKHGTAHAMLGLCEFEMGNDAAALRDIEASKDLGTDIDPQLRDVIFYHEGLLLQRTGRFVGAQKAFSSLCLGGARSPDLIRAFGMAALQMRDKDFPPAGSEAAQVVEQVGNAACLAAQKKFDASKGAFARAVQSHPDFPYAHYAFGRELVEVHDVAGAVAEFKSELALGHDRLLPLLQIAAAEYRVDSNAGLAYAQQAVNVAPQVPFAHFLLGLLMMDTGSYEAAVPELEIASKGMPRESKVFWSLAAAYAHTGRPQDAARAREQFIKLNRKAAGQAQDAGAADSPDVQVNVPDESNTTPEH